MKANIIRIGNSRGLLLPYRLLELYRLKEGDELQLEERLKGIMLRLQKPLDNKLSWEDAYREMAIEVAEQAE
jgi:antitoxin component of MazEF toxin-antitoxin module